VSRFYYRKESRSALLKLWQHKSFDFLSDSYTLKNQSRSCLCLHSHHGPYAYQYLWNNQNLLVVKLLKAWDTQKNIIRSNDQTPNQTQSYQPTQIS